MSRPGTFERVYGAIKGRLLEGAFRPGDRLEPAVMADELNASVTPVRDALHRLTGERLVEAPRHDGFRIPLMTETMLRHLYAWHCDLLLLAILNRRARGWTRANADPPAGAGRPLDAAFASLVRSTGNPEHMMALDAVNERLAPAQRIAEGMLHELEAETADIVSALRRGDRRGLRSGLLRYHRRRQRIVPELLAALQS